jgi:hypothetical protein
VRMFLRSYVGYQEVEDEGDIAVDEGLILKGTLHTLGDLEAGEYDPPGFYIPFYSLAFCSGRGRGY